MLEIEDGFTCPSGLRRLPSVDDPSHSSYEGGSPSQTCTIRYGQIRAKAFTE